MPTSSDGPSSGAVVMSANGQQLSEITSSVSTALMPLTPVSISHSVSNLRLNSSISPSKSTDTNGHNSDHYSITPISVIPDQVVDSVPTVTNEAIVSPRKETQIVQSVTSVTTTPPNGKIPNDGSAPGSGKSSISNDSSRRRRTRCKKCDSCVRADCGECHFCKDMRKFGGPGRMKQSCVTRQCMTPVLPHTACCTICGKDGWERLAATGVAGLDDNQSSLMECSQCWEIVHPVCLKEKQPNLSLESGRRDDLPNSWECPKCVAAAKTLPGARARTQAPVCAKVLTQEREFHTVEVQTAITAQAQVQTNLPIEETGSSDEEVPQNTPLLNNNEKPAQDSPSHVPKLTSVSKGTSDRSLRAYRLNHKSAFVMSCSTLTVQDKVEGPVKTEEKVDPPTPMVEEKVIATPIPTPPAPTEKTEKNAKLTKKEQKRKKKTSESLKDRLFRSLKMLKNKSGSSSPSAKKMLKSKTVFAPVQPVKTSAPVSSVSESSKRGKSKASGSENNTPKTAVRTDSHKTIEKNAVAENAVFEEETDVETEEDEDEKSQTIAKKAVKEGKSIVSQPRAEGNGERKATHSPDIGLHGRPVVKPKFVVRPVPIPGDCIESDDGEDEDEDEEDDEDDENSSEDEDEREEKRNRKRIIRKHLKRFRRPLPDNLALERDVIFPTLRYLSRNEILTCSQVCKSWNAWTTDPSLWNTLSARCKRITAAVLVSIVRRQPRDLDLSWTKISPKQLAWLLPRLPQLKTLSLSGCSAAAASVLSSCTTPLLTSLDLSWTDDFDDELLQELTSSPVDQRPGLVDTKTRLRNLQDLSLAGTDISDESARLIQTHLPNLMRIDLSSCSRLTDRGIALLIGPSNRSKLTSVLLNRCEKLTDKCFDYFEKCPNLTKLDLMNCDRISVAAFTRFFYKHQQSNSKYRLTQSQNKLMC